MSHIYCPECGFQNQEAANYCSKCGTMLVHDAPAADATMTFTPEDGELEAGGAPEGVTGPALVVRSGGGRAGETFSPKGESTTVGRSPECGIFLDDVTVSRRHAVLAEREGQFWIDDLGSLNGTFLNRKRIESAQLADGDELQIGKYRMTFLSR